MFRILAAEDDGDLLRLLTRTLEKAGYEVVAASDGLDAYQKFCSTHVDLVVTDVMMPAMSGTELVERLRGEKADVPILIMTALESFEDKEKGYTLGADDYMVKPVDMPELLLHVKALLRRYGIEHENKLTVGRLTLLRDSNCAQINGERIELTKKEFALLFKLLSNPDRIFTRDGLLDELWGFDNVSEDRTVDTHIKRLREKVPCSDYEIVTVRGLGYKAVIK